MFLVNSMFYLPMFEELKSYLNNISVFLDEKAAHLKQNQPPDYMDHDSQAEHALTVEQYEEQFPVLLANSFIIVLVSTLERELSTYCNTATEVGSLAIKSSDLSGRFHEQFKVYLSKVVRMPIDFKSNSWADIKGLIEVRNTIVHNDGTLETDTSRKRVILNLYERYPTLNIKGNVLRPTIPFCNQMVQVVHDFLATIAKTADEHFK